MSSYQGTVDPCKGFRHRVRQGHERGNREVTWQLYSMPQRIQQQRASISNTHKAVGSSTIASRAEEFTLCFLQIRLSLRAAASNRTMHSSGMSIGRPFATSRILNWPVQGKLRHALDAPGLMAWNVGRVGSSGVFVFELSVQRSFRSGRYRSATAK